MQLKLVAPVDYKSPEGIQEIDHLREALVTAFEDEDWEQVRKVDQACVALIDRVSVTHKKDRAALILALRELKSTYSRMIMQCQTKVVLMSY
jgi:hypothetical protein